MTLFVVKFQTFYLLILVSFIVESFEQNQQTDPREINFLENGRNDNSDTNCNPANNPNCYWWNNKESPIKDAIDFFSKKAKKPTPEINSKNPFFNGKFNFDKDPQHSKPNLQKNPFLKDMFSAKGTPIQEDNNGFLGVQPVQPFKKPKPFTKEPPKAETPKFDTRIKEEDGPTCGFGHICVPKEQCSNGILRKEISEGLLQVRNEKQVCDFIEQVCCLVETPKTDANLNRPNATGPSELSFISVGKSSVPGGSILKFAGGLGLSPGVIHVIPPEQSLEINYAGEFGATNGGSTSKPTRDISSSFKNSVNDFNGPPVIDLSNADFGDVRFGSTIKGPAYLPPVGPSQPSSQRPEIEAPKISTYSPTQKTPLVINPIVNPYPTINVNQPTTPSSLKPEITYTSPSTQFPSRVPPRFSVTANRDYLPPLPSTISTISHNVNNDYLSTFTPSVSSYKPPQTYPRPSSYQPSPSPSNRFSTVQPQKPTFVYSSSPSTINHFTSTPIPKPAPSSSYNYPKPSPTPGYQYPKPSPPFTAESNRIQTSTLRPYPTTNPNIYLPPETKPPSPTPGYQYPKPSPPFPLPSDTVQVSTLRPYTPSSVYLPASTKPVYQSPSPTYNYPKPTPTFNYPKPSPSIPTRPPQPSPTPGYNYPKPTPTFNYPNYEGASGNDNNQYIPPPRSTPPPKDIIAGGNNQYDTILPPDHSGGSSNADETVVPPAACAAALKCVQEIYCTVGGVISTEPVVLTKEQEINRVPTTPCRDIASGITGKCCRDPNYVDPWPSANLVNGFDDGQYKEDASLGQYQQSSNLVRASRAQSNTNFNLLPNNQFAKNEPEPKCGVRNFNTKPEGPSPLNTNFAEIPWQAMILRNANRSLLCGGAIIKQNAVLTTAHCVKGLATNDILVKGGEWKLGIDEEPLPFQILKVAVVVIHPGYKEGSLVNDLAVLLLAEKFRASKNIGTICLPPPNQIPTRNCIATGWGKRILQLHAKGAIMRSVDIHVLDSGTCEQTLSQKYQQALPNFSPNTLCAFSNNDQCKVDYGSALACSNDNQQYTLSGVFSWDTGCKDPSQIGGYVAPDVEWIEKVVSKPVIRINKF